MLLLRRTPPVTGAWGLLLAHEKLRGGAQAKLVPKVFEGWFRKGFGEDVRSVFRQRYMDDVGQLLLKDVPDGVVLDMNVFCICVIGRILR